MAHGTPSASPRSIFLAELKQIRGCIFLGRRLLDFQHEAFCLDGQGGASCSWESEKVSGVEFGGFVLAASCRRAGKETTLGALGGALAVGSCPWAW